MKYTKELQPILTAIFAINRTNGHEDQDISLILDYAFRRLFGANTNLLTLACVGRTKEEIMPEVNQLLAETEYEKYLEIEKMKPFQTQAHIHSLDGAMDYVTILDEKMIGKQKTYLVDYGGVKCTAVFNPFTGQYYADDIYGRIEE